MTEVTVGEHRGVPLESGMTTTAVSPRGRLRSLDCLRGAAALSVVVHHAMKYGDALPTTAWLRPIAAITDQGYLGVPLFFVISGFCIHLRWARKFAESGTTTLDFASFWKRRVHRLYPPYLVALCLSMALVVIAARVGAQIPMVLNYPSPRGRWMACDFLAHLLMLHGLHPVFDKGGGNGVYWTLAREEYFYALYFILLAWRRAWGLAVSVGLVFLLGLVFPIVMRPLVPADSRWWVIIQSSAIVLWIQWCLGMIAVESYYGIVRLPSWCSWPALIPVWAGLAVATSGRFVELAPLLWGMTFFTLLNFCVRREEAGRWPGGAFFEWLAGVGVFSYSLYLIHVPVQGTLKRLLGSYATTRDPLAYLRNAGLIIVAAYVSGLVFFHLVERRFLNTRPTESA